jgi:hypothetical protein
LGCGWGRDRGSNNATWRWENEDGSIINTSTSSNTLSTSPSSSSESSGIDTSSNSSNATGTVLYTTIPRGYHFTKDGPSTPLRMEQWIRAGSSSTPEAPYLTMRYRLTYAEEGPAWGATTQEIPAIFTAHGEGGEVHA